jgi:hypothetical protein
LGRNASIIGTLVALAAAPAVSLAFDGTLRTVMLSDQQTFLNLAAPALNGLGQTLFLTSAANPTSLWSEGSGSLQMVATVGTQSNGQTLTVFGNFPTINDAGQFTFNAASSDSGGSRNGLWVGGPAQPVSVVALAGQQVPGLPSGTNFDDGIATPAINNSGQIIFKSGQGWPQHSLWSFDSGNFRLVAEVGDEAPGTSPGVTFAHISTLYPSINASGKTTFIASLTGSGIDSTNNGGIWTGDADGLQLVARRGDNAPGAAAGVSFSEFVGPYVSPPLNTDNQIAFSAGLTDGNEGIWTGMPGSLSLVALKGTQAPGMPAGWLFSDFVDRNIGYEVRLNNANQVAFMAEVSDGGASKYGVWMGTPGNLNVVGLSGDQAPGAPLGVSFTAFFPWDLGSNNAGQIAGGAALDDGNGGIWATDVTGELQLIALGGEVIEVAPDDFRTIDTAFMRGDTATSGRLTGLNDLGQVAFVATFTDGTYGIFVSNKVAHALPGDFNADLIVDAADYVLWRKTGGTPAQYNLWRTNFGARAGSNFTSAMSTPAPEPSALSIALMACSGLAGVYPRNSNRKTLRILNARTRVRIAK